MPRRPSRNLSRSPLLNDGHAATNAVFCSVGSAEVVRHNLAERKKRWPGQSRARDLSLTAERLSPIRRRSSLTPFLLLLLLATSLRATTFLVPTDRDLVAGARAIVTATAGQSAGRRAPG